MKRVLLVVLLLLPGCSKHSMPTQPPGVRAQRTNPGRFTALGPGHFPWDNVWYAQIWRHVGLQGEIIPALPVHSNSATWLNTIFNVAPLGNDPGKFHVNLGTSNGHYVNLVGGASGFHNVHVTGPGTDAATFPPNGGWASYPYTVHASVLQGGDPDQHCLMEGIFTNTLYEMYRASYGSMSDSNACWDGVRWNMNSDSLIPNGCSSADEAGLPISVGLFTYDELFTDQFIGHALRFQSNSPNISAAANSWVWPARHKSNASTKANPIPFGIRLRLKTTFVPTHAESLDVGFMTLTRAMMAYGAMCADRGSSQIALSGVMDSRWGSWPDTFMQESADWIPYLEFVDQSGHMVDPNSGQFNP